MFLNEQLTDAVSIAIKQYSGTEETFQLLKPVSGGSINKCFQIKYGKDFFFLKVNSSDKLPNMFVAEAEGLKHIRSTNTIQVPKVICYGSAMNEQFLILEWIERGVDQHVAQELLGRGLAQLHKNTRLEFGLDHNNYMGSLTQSNKRNSSWTQFFINERLRPQVDLGIQNGFLTNKILEQFESLYQKLDSLYPFESPALVHGDLWSGNYLISNLQQPLLIDPAISYANREVDIAMTTLFGGFQYSFYEAYHEVFPLQEGWKKRMDLWNLYPVLIHVNLFGSSYLNGVKQILNQYS